MIWNLYRCPTCGTFRYPSSSILECPFCSAPTEHVRELDRDGWDAPRRHNLDAADAYLCRARRAIEIGHISDAIQLMGLAENHLCHATVLSVTTTGRA